MSKTTLRTAGVAGFAMLACGMLVAGGLSAQSGTTEDASSQQTTQDRPADALRRTIKTSQLANETHAVAEYRNEDGTIDAEKTRAEAKKQALERLAQKKAEVKSKLDERRRAKCQERENKINTIIAQRAGQGAKHYEVFKKIKDRVITFTESKEISPDGYAALLASVNEKEQAVIVAIETAKTVKLDCAAESSDKNMGNYIRQSVSEIRESLKAYRTSVKDLIAGVKQAAETKVNATESQSGGTR